MNREPIEAEIDLTYTDEGIEYTILGWAYIHTDDYDYDALWDIYADDKLVKPSRALACAIKKEVRKEVDKIRIANI